jgi:cell division protein FtsQ
LPEGEESAGKALTQFARMDKLTGLLGRGLVRFDLRIPGKMIVRLPRAPGEGINPDSTSQAPAEG